MPGFVRFGTAVFGLTLMVLLAPFAHADPQNPQDPHQPDLPKNYCPGGQWGFGRTRVCDGDKYPDGSYWHQWMGGNGWSGPTWRYDCVGDSGNNIFPAPPPPGGCDGAIPPDAPGSTPEPGAPPPDESPPPAPPGAPGS